MDNRSLISKISKAADAISRSSIRGSANYFVTSKENYQEFHKVLRKHRRVEKIKRLFELKEDFYETIDGKIINKKGHK